MTVLENVCIGAKSQQLIAEQCFPGEWMIHLILSLFQNTAILEVKLLQVEGQLHIRAC